MPTALSQTLAPAAADTFKEPFLPPTRHDESAAAQLAYTSYLRVGAIVGVVLIHTAGLTYINDDLRGTGVWWVAALVTFGVKWAVPTFVMVSGALLLKPPADRSATLFYRRRLSRIGIPLVVWHLVYITLTATVVMTTMKPRALVADFLKADSYTGLYFFWLILGLYLITPLLWPVVAATSQRALGMLGAALVALAAINTTALQLIGRLEGGITAAGAPTVFSEFIPYIGFFILGYALRDVIVHGRGPVLALAALTSVLSLETLWQVSGGPTAAFGLQSANRLNILMPVHQQGWVVGASAVAMFVLVRSVAHPESRWARPRAARRARSIGDLTLGVWATHLLVLFVLLRVPGHEWQSGAKTMPQLLALCTATLLCATALTMIIKRIPLLRRSV
jgi:surface polysaccharide O-acyltransferase-like enzyme